MNRAMMRARRGTMTKPAKWPKLVHAGFQSSRGTASGFSLTGISGIEVNDVTYVFLWSNNSNSFPTPSGWTLLSTNSSTTMSYAIFWQRHTSGGSNSVTVTVGGTTIGTSNYWFGRRVTFRGCATSGNPHDTFSVGALVGTDEWDVPVISGGSILGSDRTLFGFFMTEAWQPSFTYTIWPSPEWDYAVELGSGGVSTAPGASMGVVKRLLPEHDTGGTGPFATTVAVINSLPQHRPVAIVLKPAA